MRAPLDELREVAPLRAPAVRRPPEPARRGPGIAALLLGAVVVLFAAAAGGWALHAAVRSAPYVPPPAPRAVDVGPMTLAVAGGWVAESTALAGLPGLDERTTASFAPAPGLRAHAVVTLAPVDDPSLVPAPLRTLIAKPLAEPARAELLGVPAWRYSGLELSGGRLMDVTVAPSTAGVLTVVCTASRNSWAAAAGCASGLRRLSIEGAAWLPPAADLALRARVPAIVERLDRRRVDLRARLRRATTRRGQSRLATRLGRAYERAAASLAPSAPASGPPQRIIAALGGSAAAHRKLAVAADNGWPRRYGQARRAVKRGDAALKRELAALGR